MVFSNLVSDMPQRLAEHGGRSRWSRGCQTATGSPRVPFILMDQTSCHPLPVRAVAGSVAALIRHATEALRPRPGARLIWWGRGSARPNSDDAVFGYCCLQKGLLPYASVERLIA